MKDWKTYALIALAAWCAYLTWKVAQPQDLDPEAVWDAYQSVNAPKLKPASAGDQANVQRVNATGSLRVRAKQ